MSGEQFLANSNPKKMEVHDLDKEKTGPFQCQIDEIIRAGHDRPFGSLNAARLSGYDNCAYCLGNSTR
jgi:hypothetical protein